MLVKLKEFLINQWVKWKWGYCRHFCCLCRECNKQEKQVCKWENIEKYYEIKGEVLD